MTAARAHGVPRKNFSDELTLGSFSKQRIGIRCASSAKPYASTSFVTIVSSVTPFSGSTAIALPA
jgi:hypothetical protein